MTDTGCIDVGGRKIGRDQPCFIAAEIGINHNGDMDLARRTIEAAAAAGADAVKFQNYSTGDFLDDEKLTYTYQSQGKEVTESQWAMFKRCELSNEQFVDLKAHCDKNDILFFSTPTSEEGVDFLARLAVPLLKNGSDFLPNLDLIRAMARTAIPTVLSTGMATAAEIDDAVSAFRDAGGEELFVLHCTSSYPTPPAEVNLRRIRTLAQAFNCPVGFSDHSEGNTAAIGAVVLGACLIEKHFTFDCTLPGPDHRFSSDPKAFGDLVRAVREIEAAVGSPELRPTASESRGRSDYRLSCHASSDIAAGTRISPSHISYKRPGTGIPPKLATALLGLTLKQDIRRGHVFDWSDFHD